MIGKEVHSLLIGETAVEIRGNIQRYLENQPNVIRVLNLWAINHGDGVMVAVKAKLQPDLRVIDAAKAINEMDLA